MDLRGNLQVFEPIFVFQILSLAMSSGVLRLKRKENSASIFFDHGRMAFAEIQDRPVRLGEYLVREGYISQEQLEEALKRKTRSKRLGRVLVDNKILEEEILKKALEEQIKEVIYEVVKWNEGSFSFIAGRKPNSQDFLIDMPLDHLMLEGLKRIDEAGGSSS